MNAIYKDSFRQWLNLLAAPMMWILSTIPQITNWGRSAKEFSDMNDSLLVPYGAAFSIWLPIFIGCIGYAILQGVKANRSRAIFRKTGWWTAGGFISVCIWALVSGWGSPSVMLWGTALAFLPTVYCFVKAMLILTRNKTALDRTEHIWVWAPISLIAGWTSLAIFLNWTPIAINAVGASVPLVVPNLIMLVIALTWALFIIRKSSGNLVYAFPIIWGLAWLVFKALAVEQTADIIGGTALLGLVIIAASTAIKTRKAAPSGMIA